MLARQGCTGVLWPTRRSSQKTTEVLAEMDEHIRIARELADRGWADVQAKYAAEGKPVPPHPRDRFR
jgi:hypothetical protein